PRDRVAELVRRTGNELALRDLASECLGAVADDRQDRILGAQALSCDREHLIANPNAVALHRAALGGLAQPRLEGLDHGPGRLDQRRRSLIVEAHLSIR